MISKRLRYEVLRRDGFRCRYCGAAGDGTVLVIDHIQPVALGGEDVPENLATACEACNSGKSSIAPDSPIVEDVEHDAIRWAKAIQIAAQIASEKREKRAAEVQEFLDAWNYGVGQLPSGVPVPDDWETSITTFIDAGLSGEDLAEMALVALRNPRVSSYRTWKYFCGCCWGQIKDRQKAAKSILDAGGAE